MSLRHHVNHIFVISPRPDLAIFSIVRQHSPKTRLQDKAFFWFRIRLQLFGCPGLQNSSAFYGGAHSGRTMWGGGTMRCPLQGRYYIDESCHVYFFMGMPTLDAQHEEAQCAALCKAGIIWMSHVTYMNESCHIYEWVMSHIWMSHVPQMNESCPTYEWVMSHMYRCGVCHSHQRQRSAFRESYEYVMSHMQMSHVPHIWMSHVPHI